MKKRLFAFFTAAALTFSAMFSGCSCSGDETLTFNSVNATAETLTYTVRQVEDYGSIKKNAELDNYFTFEYSVGTYTSALAEANKSDEEIKDSDILEIKDAKGTALIAGVYLLTTDFEIGLKVTVEGTDYEFTEKITNRAYIASHETSFAPLYAKSDAEYSMISVGTEKCNIEILKTVSETFYNKDSYRTVKKSKRFPADAAPETITLDGVEASETTTEYTFRSAIDSAELPFALRGLKTEEKASEKINAVWSAYNSPQPLKITNTAATERQFTLNYNGEPHTETIKYASLSFALDKTNASGAPQYASVQTEAAGNIKNTCLLLEYVMPLTTYGSFMSMGALVFTLDSVTTD